MAYNDALFQLGMDLTRSSPAQEEVSTDLKHGDVHGDQTDDVRVSTHKLIIDMTGAKKIGSAKLLEKALADALEFTKTKAITIDVRRDARGWLSAIASLKSGQVTLEACPATGFVAVDVSGASGLRPETAMFGFAEAFGAREVMIKRERSGSELAKMKPVVAITSASASVARKSLVASKTLRKAA
jgi:S-adenosylmethionine decarboxylase